MNALFIPERNVFTCPDCKGDLSYWVMYDVLICPPCSNGAYHPDTGEEQGIIR